jgi:type IV pilus assembly protein PilC
MAIKYEAYTRSGEKVTGVLDADSKEDAVGMLEQEELIPYRLKPVRKAPNLIRLAPSLFKPRSQDIIDFTRQLSALLTSGIPLRRSLMVLRDQTRSLGLKEALRQIIVDIEGGVRFSEAFARHATVFPEFYLRLLRVGEGSGGIPTALEQLADNLARRKDVTDKVKKALVYPGISLGVAFVAGFVLVTYTLPSLTSLLTEFGGELPKATQILIVISDFLGAYGIFIIGPILVAGFLIAAAQRAAPVQRIRDLLLLRLPVVGRVLLYSNMFYLTTTFSTLLRAGLAPIEAMKLTEEGLGNSRLREGLADVTREASEGARLGEAFGAHRAFPSILAQAIVTGEMRGGLADTLAGLALYYEEVTDRAVGGATELVQPAIILIVSGVVGFVAVAIISGIYSTLGTIG